MCSGAIGLNCLLVGCSRGSGTNVLAVVEYDLAVYAELLLVYSNRTPSGTSSCILYLNVYVYVYHDHSVNVYAVYTQPRSGAYRGGTVATVKGIVAENHRESMVINTGSAIISRMKSW